MEGDGEGGLVVLVTGGTGFIGSHLLLKLVGMRDQVKKVVALVRQTSKCDHLPAAVEVRRALLDSPTSLEDALHGVDLVIHLAATMDFYPKDVEELYRTNVEGTRNLLRALAKNGRQSPSFIYVSSTEAMGGQQAAAAEKADEESELRPVYEYGRSKVAAEKVVREEAERSGISQIILRPTGVLGYDDRFTIFELMEMINSGLLCFIPGSGQAKLMYTHVDDVVQAIVRAVESRKACAGETFIVCPDEALTYKRWIEVISEELGRSRPFIHLPFPVVKLATAVLAPIMNRGKSRTFMYQVDTVSRMAENREYSNAKARRLLGFKPKYGLEEAVRQTVRYNLDHGHIVRHRLSPVILYTLVAMALTALAFHFMRV